MHDLERSANGSKGPETTWSWSGGFRSFAARFTNVRDADEPEIRRRAEVDWNTLALELDDLPPFDERFAMMRELYVSLPWS